MKLEETDCLKINPITALSHRFNDNFYSSCADANEEETSSISK